MNKERGEIELEVLGRKYVARPTHEAMANIEALADTGILDIANRCFSMKVSSRQIAIVIFSCIREGLELKPGEEMPFTLDELWKYISGKNLTSFFVEVTKLVKPMVSGETIEESEQKKD